jgi:hypothetical protein
MATGGRASEPGRGVVGARKRKRRYENDALAFLDERLVGMSGGVGGPVLQRAKGMG